MNRILKVILSTIIFSCLSHVFAYEITYSSWSSVYPSSVAEELIQSEERFLWYKEKEDNIEYLKKEDIGNKLVDYNDYKLTEESTPSEEEPVRYEDRIINESYKDIIYTDSDVNSIRINNINFNDEVLISEIEIIDKNSSNKLDFNTNKSELNDNDYQNYIRNTDDIYINFNELKDINNLLIKLYYRCECNNENTFKIDVLSKDEYNIYSNQYNVSNCVMEIDKSLLNENLTNRVKIYSYIDKLYKTYEIGKDITDEYYKELDGYIKLESSSKTFYRYITNEYLYFDTFGNIVYNENYCKKNRCTKKYYYHNEEEKVYNPKTIDNIDYYFIAFIISFVLIVIIMIVKRVKMNKKSSFVESI